MRLPPRSCLLLPVLLAALAVLPAAAETPPPAPADEAPVRVHDRVVFVVRAPRGATPASQRASAAAQILGRLLELRDTTPTVALQRLPGSPAEHMLRVGGRDVFAIGPADIERSGQSAEIYLETLRAQVETSLAREVRRATLQERVQAVSMVVFLGLVAFLLLRWVRRRSEELEQSLSRSTLTLPELRIRNMRVLSPHAMQSWAYVLLSTASLVLQIGILYAYLAFALVQFAPTRPWAARLTLLMVSPLGDLARRLGGLLPAALLLVAGGYALQAALHVARLFFDHTARGELRPRWLPRDLAHPARVLALPVLTIGALLIVAGLLTQDELLVRVVLIGLCAVALAAVPLLCAVWLGVALVFSRRFRLGEWVAIGDEVGEVTEVGLLDVTLVPAMGGRVRLPYLITLLRPVHHLPGPPPLVIDLPADPAAPPQEVCAALEVAAAPLAAHAEAHLHAITATARVYRVTLREPAPGAERRALQALAQSLRGGAAVG